jgi:thioredoxin 1
VGFLVSRVWSVFWIRFVGEKKTKKEESNHSRVARIFSLSLFKILSITGVTSVVNDQTFEQDVLKSDVPVLVDFWAPWCGPCRMIAPLIDQLAEEYAGKLKAVKLNTDESPSIATEYGIRSIPTVMIFKDGKKMDTVIGAVPKSTLTGTIEKYL